MKVLTRLSAPFVSVFGNEWKSRVLVNASCGMGYLVFETRIALNRQLNCHSNNGSIVNRNLSIMSPLTQFVSKAHYIISGVVSINDKSTLKQDCVAAGGINTNINIKAMTNNVRILSVFNHSMTNISIPKDEVIKQKLKCISLSDCKTTFWGNGDSNRFLLEKDNFGFTVTNTTVTPNSFSNLEYKNHFESCYYIEGNGKYEWDVNGSSSLIETNNRHSSIDGDDDDDDDTISKCQSTMMIMNNRDAHILAGGDKQAVNISIFCPALKGDEKHDFTKTYSEY